MKLKLKLDYGVTQSLKIPEDVTAYEAAKLGAFLSLVAWSQSKQFQDSHEWIWDQAKELNLERMFVEETVTP